MVLLVPDVSAVQVDPVFVVFTIVPEPPTAQQVVLLAHEMP